MKRQKHKKNVMLKKKTSHYDSRRSDALLLKTENATRELMDLGFLVTS